MTPEEKESVRQELERNISGTVDEWCRIVGVEVEDHPLEGVELRINWESPTDNVMIASVSRERYGDPIARFGVQLIVETLPDLPAIGPENDLGIYGIDDRQEPAPECTCAMSEASMTNCAVHGYGSTEEIFAAWEARQSPPAPEWVPATLGDVLVNDRIRIGTDEATVLMCTLGVWNADASDAWRPKAWKHTELRMSLDVVPIFQPYPPNTPCEVLCTPERKAVLLLQVAFPGSQITSSHVDS